MGIEPSGDSRRSALAIHPVTPDRHYEVAYGRHDELIVTSGFFVWKTLGI